MDLKIKEYKCTEKHGGDRMKWLNIEGIKKIKTLEEFERWEKIEEEKEEKFDYKKMTTLEKIKNLEDAKKIHNKLETDDRIIEITKHYKGNKEEMIEVVIEMRINGNIERKILIN
ncbi:hypothetical protein NRK67_16865 (plasmid) [Fusobacteria bacterium ZRK30]|nr:hypothetical protein NRK67_16865 [Fusobacteria bacterium ZRK30]